MRNHSFYELSKQGKYEAFNVKTSESGLYLSLTEKRLDASSIFEEPEYSLFELEDIHVSVLEQYEINRKPAVRSYKSSSPFHITLRFSEKDTGRLIVIHDFYSSLDLSRDFHVQLKEGETLTYLPQQTIDLSKLNQLIEKEVRLVKELIDKNNKHEQDLRRSIDAIYEDLFSRAQQANLFPETMGESDYHHFHQSLTKIIAHLEQLIHLGHHHESRRLAYAQREFDHLTKSMQSVPQASQQGQAAAEVKVLTKASKASSQKSASKKDKSQKQKNGSEIQLTAFLNAFYEEVQAIKARKQGFLEEVKTYLLTEETFEPLAILAHLNAHLDILSELTNDELDDVIINFFKQFSYCQDSFKQSNCLEVAEFLSLNVPSFSNFMSKLSLMSFESSSVRISSFLMAFLNNNIPYWEFMHSYGISFADNRHILVGGIAGNILHGILYLIQEIPAQSFYSILPFVQLLFRYLEEDGMKLRNMISIAAMKPENVKKVSTKTSLSKVESEEAAESLRLNKQFADNIRKEPYGTVLIMDAIEDVLNPSKKRRRAGKKAEDWVDYLMPLLVDFFILLMPQISTTVFLNAFQRLLDLQMIALYDERFSQKIMAKTDLPALDLLTEFSLVYVGAVHKEPMSRLLDAVTTSLTERLSTTSNSVLSHLMQDYYMLSKTEDETISLKLSMFPDEENKMSIYQINHKLPFAKIAYFLFTIKAKRGMFLTHDDYRVLFSFYELLFSLETFKLKEDTTDKHHQEVFQLIEALASAFWGLDLPEAVQAPLLASAEFLSFFAIYDVLVQENEKMLAEKSPMGLGVN